jgi:23S rRNA (cytidine1920-2'-O)/16S rRNA (cytidine1409-2'-O)-methyltransferase
MSRLDQELVTRDLVKTRSQARLLIKGRFVEVDGVIVEKSSFQVKEKDQIIILKEKVYVGRGADKLDSVFNTFGLNVIGKIGADVGASTGGFTEYLLEKGASRIYAIDVGTDQLDDKLKNDNRVVSLEKTDIRSIKELPDEIDFAVIDVSFISAKKVLLPVRNLLSPFAEIILLFKPQFEQDPDNKIKKSDLLKSFFDFAVKEKFPIKNLLPSGLSGKSGTQEYFLHLDLSMGESLSWEDLKENL